jgi:competence protein ComEC
MPLITVAYLALLAGMLGGLAGHAAHLLAAAALLAAASALGRRMVTGGVSLVLAAGTIAGAGARQQDESCRLEGARRGVWTAVLDGDARPRSMARGRWKNGACSVRMTIAVERGASPAGSTVRVTGQGIAGRDAIIVRNAVVTWHESPGRLHRWRDVSGREIDKLFASDAALARALIIADQRAISRDIRDRFADAGLVHLLAVSGLHVAILAAAVQLVLSILRVPGNARLLSATLITAAYVVLIGAPPAALRAGGMLASMTVGRWLQRPTSPWALWSLGALIPLYDPRTAASLGYQLSVAGMAAVICSGVLERRLLRRSQGWKRKLAAALITSIVAAAATGPLVTAVFGRLSLISPISNVVAAPLIAAAQPALFLALALSPLPAVAQLIADGARAPLFMLDRVAAVSAAVPFAAVSVAPMSSTSWLLIVATASGVVACCARWFARPLLVSLAAVSVAAWLPARGSGLTELHVLDVGQGDALAIRTARGRWILVDAGRAWQRGDAARSTIIPYLRRLGGPVEALILTHPHLDHIGGASSLLRTVRPRVVYDPAFAGEAATYSQTLKDLEVSRSAWRAAHSGRAFSVDEITVTFIGPDSVSAASERNPNNASAVTLVTAGSITFLLMGDAEAEEEAAILRSGALRRVDVLKVGHHGSSTSSTPHFLDAARPRLALISVGAINNYGHPDRGVISELLRRGSAVLRTDREGTIVVRTNGRTVSVETGEESWDLPVVSSQR